MKYEVEVVADDELPGMERVIVERPNGPPLLIITEAGARTWAFLHEWEESHREPAQVIELQHRLGA